MRAGIELKVIAQEIAAMSIGLISSALFCAAPVVAWFVVAGWLRLTHSYPP